MAKNCIYAFAVRFISFHLIPNYLTNMFNLEEKVFLQEWGKIGNEAKYHMKKRGRGRSTASAAKTKTTDNNKRPNAKREKERERASQ